MVFIGRIGLAATVIAVVASIAVTGAPATREASAREGFARQTASALRGILANLAASNGPRDPDFLAAGVWHGDDSGYWYCNVGAGTAAAVLWRTGGQRDGVERALAVSTFDRAIATHRNANGSFGPPTESPDIETASFGDQLGTAYIELSPGLSQAERSRWQTALAGGADFLVRNGNLTWYTNGNINLSETELFYLAWRATGQSRFWQDYNQAWRFTLDPPQARWSGFGLHIEGTRFPTTLRFTEGQAGYLAESGGGKPGFDADYAVIQLDAAADLYLLSGDSRAKLLSDLLVNMLLPRTNDRSLLDTSGGTRHPQQERFIPLLTSGLAVLGTVAGRYDLASLFPAQLRTVISTYKGALSYGYSPYLYRGLGTQLSMILLAESPST